MALKDVHILIHWTCEIHEYINLYGKEDFAYIINWKILESQEIILDYSDGII